MAAPLVISRLERIQRIAKVRIVAYGGCVVGTFAVAGALILIALDYLLWLPSLPRIVGVVIGLGVLIWAVNKWIIGPASQYASLEQIAKRLEAHFAGLEDCLTSTVNFVQNPPAESSALIRQVITDTGEQVAHIDVNKVLTVKPLLRVAAAFVLTIVIAGSVSISVPGWVRTGVARYTAPFSILEWPRRVGLTPVTRDLVLPLGEPATVRMCVTRGLNDELRGLVHFEDERGGRTTMAMSRDEEGVFVATLDSVTVPLTYWFEAGDNRTKKRAFRVTPVPRPEVISGIAYIYPPDYSEQQKPVIRDLGEERFSAPIGGRIHLELNLNKPIDPSTASGVVGVIVNDSLMVPYELVGEAPSRQLEASWRVDGDQAFEIKLIDDYGFENRGSFVYRISGVPDQPPTVAVVDPRATVEATPGHKFPLRAIARDDYGIKRLSLLIREARGSVREPVALTIEFPQSDASDQVIAESTYELDLSGMDVEPGDLLVYQVEAEDNLTSTTAYSQVSQSPEMRIRIISEVEFQNKLRDELVLLRQRIRQVLLDQTELLDMTDALVTQSWSEESAVAKSEALTSMVGKQARLIKRLSEVANRASVLTDRMSSGGRTEDHIAGRVKELVGSLKDIASGAMSRAAGSLEEGLRKRRNDTLRDAHLTEAMDHESLAVEALRRIVEDMAQWGDFSAMITRTTDLMDRQRDLRNSTADLGKVTLGKTVEELTPAQAAELTRVRRKQEQLGQEVEQLIERLSQLTNEREDTNPAGAEAMKDALNEARGGDVHKRLAASLKALEQNRTAAAGMDQKTVEDTLRAMAEALRGRQDRELELLRKRISEARDRVARILEEQRGLRASTDELEKQGAAVAEYKSVAEAQRRLGLNTRFLAGELLQDVQSAEPAAKVADAVEPMRVAHGTVQDGHGEAALPAQDEAIEYLSEAIRLYEEMTKRASEEAMRRSLARVHVELMALLDAQKKLTSEMKALETGVSEKGRVSRSEARQANRIARAQDELRQNGAALADQLSDAVVYQWALLRVDGWMETIVGWLSSRKVDEELVETSDRIVNELERLLFALRETQSLPINEEFAESGGGGAGGQGGRVSREKPIPTLAELLVIKSLQTDINERTRSLHESIDLTEPSEGHLRKMRILGEDQEQVRALTDKLTEKARGRP